MLLAYERHEAEAHKPAGPRTLSPDEMRAKLARAAAKQGAA